MRLLSKVAVILALGSSRPAHAETCESFASESAIGMSAGKTVVQGGGAAFPSNLYIDAITAWEFNSPQGQVSYHVTSSSRGRCRLTDFCGKCDHPWKGGSDSVQPAFLDFAGSDSLVSESDYAAFPDIQMYPSLAGAVVPTFNLNHVNITDLRLDMDTLSRIFRKCWNETDGVCLPGSITHWNDPDIVNLNPDIADRLAVAGEITVVVRGDSSGQTSILKGALADYDADFATQIGTGGGASWPGVDVVFGDLNTGVNALLASTSGSIGYSVLAEAEESGLAFASMVPKGGSEPIIASTSSVSRAVLERGLNFGNNGQAPERLTASLFNSERGWPIASFTHFVLRKNTTRPGATCENRRQTLKFLTWFYTASVVKGLADRHGFARLPEEIMTVVLERMRSDLFCDDGSLVYQPPPRFVVEMEVNSIIDAPLSTLLYVYEERNENIALEVRVGDTKTDTLLNDQDRVQLKIGFTKNMPPKTSNIEVFPFLNVKFAVLVNACSNEHGCAKKVSMTPRTLASILDGTITSWNSNAIKATDISGNLLELPNEPIQLLRSTDVNEIGWEKELLTRLEGFVPSFTGIKSTEVNWVASDTLIQSTVAEIPWTIAVIPYASLPPPSLVVAHLSMEDQDVGIHSTDYPLKAEISMAFPTQFKCSDAFAEGVANGHRFSLFVYWLLEGEKLRASMSASNMDFILGSDDPRLDEVRVAVQCDGKSVMQPDHNYHVVHPGFRGFMLTVVSLVWATTILGTGWILRNRQNALVKASTWTFMVQILWGCSISVTSIVFLLQDDYAGLEGDALPPAQAASLHDYLSLACFMVPVCFFLGYALIVVPLILKTWRIRVIFNNAKLRKVKIPNSLLLKYEGLVICVVVAILVAWYSVDPIHWHRTVVQVSTAGRPIESIGRCECNNATIWLSLLFGFVLVTLATGLYFSSKIQNVPVQFAEGRWLAVCMLNYFEWTLLTPMFAMTVDAPALDVIIKCIFVSIVNIGTIVIIFAPKVVLWRKGLHQVSSTPAAHLTSENNKISTRHLSTTETRQPEPVSKTNKT